MVAIKGPAGAEVLELEDGQGASVSSGTSVRIRANAATLTAEVSAFGSAYAALGGGSVLAPADGTTYSFVNNLAGSGTASMGSFASFTQGVSFMPLRQRVVTGVRFWCDLTIVDDFKVSLWEANSGSRLADGTATVPTGPGYYEINFSTPYSMLESDIGTEMRATIYHTTGTQYPRALSTGGFMPAVPFVAGIYIQSDFNLFGSGDSYPTSSTGSESYIVEPIFQKVSA